VNTIFSPHFQLSAGLSVKRSKYFDTASLSDQIKVHHN
jgi:hypothetical protein